MIRWGFLSTAQIGRKNWAAIRQAGDVVAGLASRDLARARQVIAEWQAATPFPETPRAFGSYEALIASPEIDAIYAPLPTSQRAPWVIRAAQAGKHVLCEKPCATSAAELETMLAACARAGVQFMDGVMFMHSPRLRGRFGPPEAPMGIPGLGKLDSSFHFRLDGAERTTNIRIRPDLEPTGCLGDLGWYCIRLALWAQRWRLPQQVIGHSHFWTLSSGGRAAVPTRFEGRLEFEGGVTSSFTCSFEQDLTQWARLSTAEGEQLIEDFVLPGDEPPEQSQETRMFREFAAWVGSGRRSEIWLEIYRRTQRVTDACFRSAEAGGRPEQVGA